jgi:hypothetical protein
MTKLVALPEASAFSTFFIFFSSLNKGVLINTNNNVFKKNYPSKESKFLLKDSLAFIGCSFVVKTIYNLWVVF